MSLITVDAEACKRDGMCLEVCPTRCIEADADGLPKDAAEINCIACGHCVAVCPHGALSNSNVDISACLPAPKNLPGAEETRGLLISRRSVRAYKDKPLEKDVLGGLLDTARRAPTAVNSQKVCWVANTDPAKGKAVAAETIVWLRAAGVYPWLIERWDKGHDTVLRGAPAFVVAYSPKDYNWGVEDCTIALSYLEIAAASAGVGACWAGLLTRAAQNHAPLAAMLGIPADHRVHGGLMLGYPKYRYRLVPSRNEARVHWM